MKKIKILFDDGHVHELVGSGDVEKTLKSLAKFFERREVVSLTDGGNLVAVIDTAKVKMFWIED